MQGAKQDWSFPRSARLRRRADFQKVYDLGFRMSGPFFSGICLRAEGQAQGKVGFAVPSALGGSVVRNRLKRRLREAARTSAARPGEGWNVVIQARRGALEAPFGDLKREVERLFSRCALS